MALGPPRPADAVDVVLILLRHVEVEDGVHIVHVDAPAGHVRGHEHMELALPELGHDLLPLLLGDISVDALGVQPRICKNFVSRSVEPLVLQKQMTRSSPCFLMMAAMASTLASESTSRRYCKISAYSPAWPAP